MNKTSKKVLIAISCVCVAVILIGIGIIAYIENGVKHRYASFLPIVITRAEKAYSKEENFENLYNLCDSLFFSGEDEKIVKYFPEILFDGQYKSNFETEEKAKLNYDLFLTSYLISVYRLQGIEQMQTQLEKYGTAYNFPLKRSLYLKEFVENTSIPQQGESWVHIYQVFSDYTQKYGTPEEKELAKSSYEMIQKVVEENTQADGTLYIAEE